MGLSTTLNYERSQGWLAAFTCCWTAGGDEEVPESNRTWPVAAHEVCLEQPEPLTAMPSLPTSMMSTRSHNHSSNDSVSRSQHDLARPISDLPPLLRPLDFGDSSYFTKPAIPARHRNSIQAAVVGNAIELRRSEPTEGHRNSLVPVKLGPVVLRDLHEVDPSSSSVAPSETISRSTDTLVGTSDQVSSYRQSYISRSRYSNSSTASTGLTPPRACENVYTSHSTADIRSPKQTLSTQSSSSSIRSMRLRTMDSFGSLAPSMASFDRHWLKRKLSNQSVAKSVYEIDREILELNTIVEERRAEAARSVSPSEHVPAVAPSMPIRARSKTLTDIGSAFSKPAITSSSASSRLSRPFMPDLFGPEIVDPIPRPATAHSTSGTKTRLSGWITGLLRPSPSAHNSIDEPFYKCNTTVLAPPVSTSSLCTLVTDLESPCLTTASSPASKSHARTLTSDSREPPVSALPIMNEPPSTQDKNGGLEDWPLVLNDASQVGVAL